MNNKLQVYKKEGTLALKHMWIVICILGVVQIIVSIACAAANEKKGSNGHHSASFAALWSMFLVILFVFIGYKIVKGGKSHPLLVGFMIGVAFMLSQLCFVLMCMFFTLGTEASTNGWSTAPSDKAYGVFSLFNMIVYFVWGIILVVHRNMVIENVSEQPQQQYYEDEGEIQNTDNPAGTTYEEDGNEYQQNNNDDEYENEESL